MEYLPEPQFIQVHRSFVINSLKVEAIEGNQLVIQNYKIPIARNLREATFESLLKNKLISRWAAGATIGVLKKRRGQTPKD